MNVTEPAEAQWPAPATFPQRGIGKQELLADLVANRHDDADWRAGRLFSLIYHPDNPELEDALAAVSREYLAENALNPFRFPSLARLERETGDMVADLLHGTPGAGGVTSGGTESILVAVYVARELARERGNPHPVLVTGITAHPAFAKACHLLGVEQVRVPVGPDHRIDVDSFADAIDDRTAMVVASAPNYPFGVIDPVEQVASMAAERGILCHVDACLGRSDRVVVRGGHGSRPAQRGLLAWPAGRRPDGVRTGVPAADRTVRPLHRAVPRQRLRCAGRGSRLGRP